MGQLVKVRTGQSGKIESYDTGDLLVLPGDKVVVETASGLDIGQVTAVSPKVSPLGNGQAVKRIVRKATPADLEQEARNEERATRALRICREKAAKQNLNMDPVRAECALDGSKIIIYFLAEGRVDFRELVRELAGALRTRVELRQIGVRDEARMLGGLGPCGRPLCCTTFLEEFKPVSIKMAKEQHLSLNPGKISGICGRLMCCLRYESQLADGEKGRNGEAAKAKGAEAAGCGNGCGGCGRH